MTWIRGAMAAAATAVVASGCGAAGVTTATTTVTVTQSAPMPTPSPTPRSTPTPAPTVPPSPQVVGTDPNGPACASLTVAQIEEATGRHVTVIKSGNDRIPNHRYSCSWSLDASGDFGGGYVSVTAIYHPNPAQLTSLASSMRQDVAKGVKTDAPGIGERAVLLKGAISSDVQCIVGQVDITVAVRLAYANVPQNADVALALAAVAVPLLKLTS